jgi:hypothetical protein
MEIQEIQEIYPTYKTKIWDREWKDKIWWTDKNGKLKLINYPINIY